jgi:NAD(P)-dependent dehydrogenase (short-subunit alcohol dehydrogenase family)
MTLRATSAVKHNANFSAFTPAKSAQKALAQSLARHLGPDKVHVSYVIIDGMIDLKHTREAMSDRPDDFFLKPDEIAHAVHFLTQQDQSAWTFELDLCPFGEKW